MTKLWAIRPTGTRLNDIIKKEVEEEKNLEKFLNKSFL